MYKYVLFYMFGMTVSAAAIVVQDNASAQNAPSGLDWSHVYNYKGSSGVAVGGNWLLTAAHVADDGGTGTLSVGGNDYLQLEVVYHSSADLALVRYDKAFPGYYPLYTGSLLPQGAAPLLSVIMVGFGTTGSVFPDHWTDSGSGNGVRRWGSQQIDRTVNEGSKFYMDFALGSTTYEAGVGIGDSGGGTFYNDGGIWKLAGINVNRMGLPDSETWSRSVALSMPVYADWVMQTVPEPGTISLMSLSMVSLYFGRTMRRRRRTGGSLLPISTTCYCDAYATMEEMTAMSMAKAGEPNPLIERVCRITPHLRAAWQVLYTRGRHADRIFWNYMVAVHERTTARRTAFRAALKKTLLTRFDAFLALFMK